MYREIYDNSKIFKTRLNLNAHSSPHKYKVYLKINNIPVLIEIFDTPGQEIYRSLLKIYYKFQDLFVFMYSDSMSFSNVKYLISSAKEINDDNCHYVLLYSWLTKDKENKLIIEDGENYSKEEGFDYFTEVCLDNDNEIDYVFFEIGKILYRNRKNRKNKK